jgi:threonyl-tRNA synthetase
MRLTGEAHFAAALQDSTMRDLLLNVRADEACHSHVNHVFSTLKQTDDNPFAKGNHMIA